MGVAAVVEQKTTILRKCLSLLASLNVVSVNLLYGFGRFNLQKPAQRDSHLPWCGPYISHRVVRHQPHAIALMAGGFYAHSRAPLAAARSLSSGYRCVPAGFNPL
jgi:hypothetical protein